MSSDSGFPLGAVVFLLNNLITAHFDCVVNTQELHKELMNY